MFFSIFALCILGAYAIQFNLNTGFNWNFFRGANPIRMLLNVVSGGLFKVHAIITGWVYPRLNSKAVYFLASSCEPAFRNAKELYEGIIKRTEGINADLRDLNFAHAIAKLVDLRLLIKDKAPVYLQELMEPYLESLKKTLESAKSDESLISFAKNKVDQEFRDMLYVFLESQATKLMPDADKHSVSLPLWERTRNYVLMGVAFCLKGILWVTKFLFEFSDPFTVLFAAFALPALYISIKLGLAFFRVFIWLVKLPFRVLVHIVRFLFRQEQEFDLHVDEESIRAACDDEKKVQKPVVTTIISSPRRVMSAESRSLTGDSVTHNFIEESVYDPRVQSDVEDVKITPSPATGSAAAIGYLMPLVAVFALLI